MIISARAAIIGLLALPATLRAQPTCADAALAVQVLGSGGLFTTSTRASSSYLIWRNGRAVILIDAGDGVLQRLGESGANLTDLELLAISHVHPDHVADLPRLLDAVVGARDRPLRLIGPPAGGAYSDIASVAGGDRGGSLDILVVDLMAAGLRRPPILFSTDGLEVSAMGVPHFPSWRDPTPPSLAFRVRLDSTTVVFGGDQNGMLGSFMAFADDAELLVMHLAISEQADAALRGVHAPPSLIGRIARQANVHRLLVGHIADPPLDHPNRAAFSGPVLQESVREMRFVYSGPIEVASDLQCIAIR